MTEKATHDRGNHGNNICRFDEHPLFDDHMHHENDLEKVIVEQFRRRELPFVVHHALFDYAAGLSVYCSGNGSLGDNDFTLTFNVLGSDVAEHGQVYKLSPEPNEGWPDRHCGSELGPPPPSHHVITLGFSGPYEFDMTEIMRRRLWGSFLAGEPMPFDWRAATLPWLLRHAMQRHVAYRLTCTPGAGYIMERWDGED